MLPPTVAAKDIYITLGSPWVPADIIDDFIIHLFGDPLKHYCYYGDREEIMEGYKTVHDEITGTWEIPYKSRYNHSVGVSRTYGTEKLEALLILEKTLNMKTVSVTEEVSCPANASGKKRVINKAETVAAIEKQQKLIKAFQKWVWTDDTRKERLEIIFENNFSCVRRRIFDGSFLDFPTMSDSVKLYPYQKNAVARIIFTPNTLLAHDVGAGKTYVMIAAGRNCSVGGHKICFSVLIPVGITLTIHIVPEVTHVRVGVSETLPFGIGVAGGIVMSAGHQVACSLIF